MKKMTRAAAAALLLILAIVFVGGSFAIAEADNPAAGNPASSDVTTVQNIPRVDIDGDMTGISKENAKDVVITYSSEAESFTSYASIKWQGSSSVANGYPKYNFSISLYEDDAHSVKDVRQLQTWNASNEYCLKANWIDATHARNIVGARLAAKMQKKLLPTGVSGLIDGFPIHVYINGDDMGLYTWNIPKKRWLFNMEPDNPDHILFAAETVTASCLFEAESDDTNDEWDLVFSSGSGTERDKLNRLIRFVRDSSIEEFRENIGEYMNLDSVIDYYVFSHIVAHIDGLAKNMLLATFDGKIWYAGLYDMDSTFGLFWNGGKLVQDDILFNPAYEESQKSFKVSKLWEKLELAFGNEIYERYVELDSGVLSYDNIIAEFENFMNEIGEDLYLLNDIRWMRQSDRYPEIPSQYYMLEQIKIYMRARAPFTRAWMEGLKTDQ